MKQITGKFESDENFITIYSDNHIYVMPKGNSRDWRCFAVGDKIYRGRVTLTQELYNEMESKCTKQSTFNLKEMED